MKILVVSPNWLGDVIMALPSVAWLKERHPESQISVLTRPNLVALWEAVPEVDGVFTYKKPLSAMWSSSRLLRKQGFAVCYVLPNSFRSAIIPFLAGIPKRVGIVAGGRGLLLTEKVIFPAELTQLHQQYENVWVLGCRDLDEKLRASCLELPTEHNPLQEAGCRGSAVVGIIPGAARGSSKQWPEERFAEVAQMMLAHEGREVVLLGTPQDKALCSRIMDSLESSDRIFNLAGATDMLGFMAALRYCDVVVANDSGGMHLGAALGTSVIGLFGLTNPLKTGPLGDTSRVLQAEISGASRKIDRESDEAREALARIPSRDVLGHIETILSSRES